MSARLVVFTVVVAILSTTSNARADKIYVMEFNDGAGVVRMNLDGSMQEELITIPPPGVTFAIAVDSLHAKLYFDFRLDGVFGIYRSNLDASDVELVVPVGAVDGLDVDPRHQKLYWVSFPGILRVDVSGGVPEEVQSGVFAADVAVDPDREQIYWIDYAGAVLRSDVAGGPIETVAETDSVPIGFLGLELDLVHRNLYWVSDDGNISMVSMDGGTVQTIRMGGGYPFDLAVDAPRGHLYWTLAVSAEIVRANLDGTGITVIPTALASPFGIALQLDCGNGRIDPGEICDVAIEPGWTGECVTECFDNDPCTSDEVTRPGTCSARCEFEAITEPIDRDGCCPNDSFTLVDDSDCTLSPWPDVPAVSFWGAVLLSLLLAVGITLKWRGHQAAA